MAEACCVKCKAKREMANAVEVKMKNGRPAPKGVCPACGTGTYKILPMKNKEGDWQGWSVWKLLHAATP